MNGIGFSAVVTNYNYRNFVADAVDSALGQDLAPAEVIVVDDGSSDGSADFLRSRYAGEPRVRIIAQENAGQLAAFATGVAAARSDVVALLDADDLWEAGYLGRIGAAYAGEAAPAFVYTNMRYFGLRDGLYSADTVSRDLGYSILLGSFATRWQATATSAISMRRSLAANLLDIPKEFLDRWKTRADDWLVCGADIAGARKFYLAEPLVRYRAHDTNAWLSRRSDGAAALHHWLRVEAMLAFHRGRAGIDAALRAQYLRYVKHEFRTKPAPSFEELRAYLDLLGQSSLRLGSRIEHFFSMWRHYLRTRRQP